MLFMGSRGGGEGRKGRCRKMWAPEGSSIQLGAEARDRKRQAIRELAFTLPGSSRRTRYSVLHTL